MENIVVDGVCIIMLALGYLMVIRIDRFYDKLNKERAEAFMCYTSIRALRREDE